MEDVDFTIYSVTLKGSKVEIVLRIEDTVDKYYTVVYPKHRFDAMNEEQLEIDLYRVAQLHAKRCAVDDATIKEKAERVKESIKEYNKNAFNK